MDPITSNPIAEGHVTTPSLGNYLLYDGDCPFCARYVAYSRAKAAFGGLVLRDARQHPELVRYWSERGFDINDGMLLSIEGVPHYGEAAIHALAMASTGSGIFNRLNARLFRSRRASKLLYPLMRSGRNATLRLLRRRQLP